MVGETDPDGATPTKTRRRSRRRAFAAVVGLLVGYYLITLAQVITTGRGDEARAVDAIVVLGAAQYDGRPSPQLGARLDHVVDLWQLGLAPLVVVTGGKIPGDRFTEAEASAKYLIERGVPDAAIVLENAGSTTVESLDSVAAMFLPNNELHVLLVTDPYHALRSKLVADEVGLVANVSPTPYSVVTGWTSARREFVEALGVAIGRVVGFRRLSGLAG